MTVLSLKFPLRLFSPLAILLQDIAYLFFHANLGTTNEMDKFCHNMVEALVK